MDQDFIVQQRQTLEREGERLDSEIAKLDKFQQIGTDQDDNAQEVEDMGDKEGAETALRTEKEQVEKALFAIEHGTYGRCDNCHGEIDKARLEAYPAATTCTKCSK